MASTDSSLPAQATSTPAANDNNDAARVIEKTMSDPRYVRGQTLLKEKRLEEAVVVYEDLLRTMIEAENQSDSLAVAPVYYQYGHSMLLLAEATASVFGGSVAQPEEGSSSGDGDAEQDAKNMADDLEVAWEMLEVARVIYSRFPDDLAVEKELARVYMRLGDLGMESDVFEQAKADYEKSLVLRKRILQATKDPDTTLLADLYCCLAISCIYQESAKPEGAAAEDSNAPNAGADSALRHDEIRKRENEGLQYYVLAGHVMAENIHRVAAACSQELQAFAAARIPTTYSSGVNSNGAAPIVGKGKQKATVKTPELLFTADGMDTLRDAFLACVQVAKSLGSGSGSGSASSDGIESLSKDEAQLLEYMEIYVELKEKVDGIIESASAEAVNGIIESASAEAVNGSNAVAASSSSGAKRSADALEDAGVTTIGFGDAAAATAVSSTTTAAAAPVNVIAVKKRKVVAATEPTATDAATKP